MRSSAQNRRPFLKYQVDGCWLITAILAKRTILTFLMELQNKKAFEFSKAFHY